MLVELSNDLFHEDAGQYDRTVNLDWPLQEGAGYFRAILDDEKALCLLADIDGAVAGFLVARIRAAGPIRPVACANLTNIYVRPALRSRGVGNALMSGFFDWLRSSGLSGATVTVYAANDRAVQFYGRYGFTARTVTLERMGNPERNGSADGGKLVIPWLILLTRPLVATRLVDSTLRQRRFIDWALRSWAPRDDANISVHPILYISRDIPANAANDVTESARQAGIEWVVCARREMAASIREHKSVRAAEYVALSSAADVFANGALLLSLASQAHRFAPHYGYVADLPTGLAPLLMRSALLERIRFDRLVLDWNVQELQRTLFSDSRLIGNAQWVRRDVDRNVAHHRVGREESIDLSSDRRARELTAALGTGPDPSTLTPAGLAAVMRDYRVTRLAAKFGQLGKAPPTRPPAGHGASRPAVACFAMRGEQRTGGDRGMMNLVAGARSSTFDYHVMCGTPDGAVVNACRAADVHVEPMPTWSVDSAPKSLRDGMDDVLNLLQVCAARSIAIIYSNTSAVGALPAIAARMANVPYVARIVEAVPRSHIDECLLPLASKIIVPSLYLKDWCIGNGIPDETLVVVPEGVSDNWFVPDASGPNIRKELGLRTDDLIVLLAGRVDDADKNVGQAVEVARRVTSRNSSVHFVLCGDIGPESAVRRVVSDRGLSDRIHFLGFRRDLRRVMQQSDLLLHTARYETFGMVVVEAMACGLPVVAARSGGLPEQIQHAQTGILVDSDDDDGLSAAVERLVLDDTARKAMGAAGRRWVQDNRSCRRFVDGIEDVLRQALGLDHR